MYFTNEELGLPKDMTIGSKANVSPDAKMPEKTDPYVNQAYTQIN